MSALALAEGAANAVENEVSQPTAASESSVSTSKSKSKSKKKKRATVASRLEDLRKEHDKLRAKFLEIARKNQGLESQLSKKTRQVSKLEMAVEAERQGKAKLADLCRALQKERELLRKKNKETDAVAESKRKEIEQSLSQIQKNIDTQVSEGAGRCWRQWVGGGRADGRAGERVVLVARAAARVRLTPQPSIYCRRAAQAV